jgi:hypothetical protein
LALGQVFADDVKMSGFVDANYRWRNLGQSSEAFRISDGALYFSKDMSNAKVMIDLPFSGGSSTTNTFSIATTQAQAWISHKCDWGITTKFGQFDGIFGYEANDSADRIFNLSGLLATGTPVTHTGLLFNYMFTDMTGMNFYVSNPPNTGALGGDNMDYGLQFNTSFDALKINFGARHWKVKANGSADSLYDLNGSYTMGDTELGGQITRKKSGTYSTTGMGGGLWVNHKFTDTMKWALRGEYTGKYLTSSVLTTAAVVGATTATSTAAVYTTLLSPAAWQVTTGPSFAMTKDLTVRMDYTYYKLKPTSGGKAATFTTAQVGGVYKF